MAKRKWFFRLFRRRLLIIFLLLLQIAVFVGLILDGSQMSELFGGILNLISVIVVLYVISRKNKGAYKLAWVILILVFPLFGGLFYVVYKLQSSTRRFAKDANRVRKKTRKLQTMPGGSSEEALRMYPEYTTHIGHLQNHSGFPVYSGTKTSYLTPGEEKWRVLLEQLEKAERYIFLEYFIVQEGVMWDSILEVLKRKAAQGVLVRLIYDDMGCFFTLPQDYPKKLREFGIECAIFNPFRPFLTVNQNNRDHRKIAVIDGKVAFTGGVNLADEYINAIEKHGHWKDSAVMLEGKAAWSFTLIFLQMWEVCTHTDEDYAAYYPWKDTPCPAETDGFVQPYADTPLDGDNVGEHVYLHIINNAKDYLYIYTPYLIVDDSMLSALTLAAKSGVDVRIVTPHRWDKWAVHMTTRSYYRDLIGAGVKVYEYSKGFIHAKSFVADDKIATVGTTNLDFRSLYLHFECGVQMVGSDAVMSVKEDFLRTLECCHRITAADCKTGIVMLLIQNLLRLVAPLM